MKKILSILLLLSLNNACYSKADFQDTLDHSEHSEMLLDIELCEEGDCIEDLPTPPQSRLQELATQIGCVLLAKYCDTKEYLDKKMVKLKKWLSQLKTGTR